LRRFFRFGLVSDAQRAYLIPELDIVGIRPLFDAIVISSDYGYRKPDPRLFGTALRQLEVPASQALYVGDNLARDICGAHNAGLRAVLLRDTGESQPEDLDCQPEMRCRLLDDLYQRLRSQEEIRHYPKKR
jgi:putative hydrolase of the HAD superfamily